VPWLKERSHLPVFVDPSHGTGIRSLVGPMALAALAAGADGVLIEVHHDPSCALSDGAQSLDEKGFRKTMRELALVANALGREMKC
jgi:3-deoxy-7-phosphoheptulonate synthase